jgi:hypothetical protein
MLYLLESISLCEACFQHCVELLVMSCGIIRTFLTLARRIEGELRVRPELLSEEFWVMIGCCVQVRYLSVVGEKTRA